MKKIVLNKILITIQGRTLILYYQVKLGLERKGDGWSNNIEVLPTAELTRFNLKGLTPDMFCVNISDMINIRGLYRGQVENERQIGVAKWELNYDEFLQLKSGLNTRLTHKQLVKILSSIPGYLEETDNQYIDFEECVVPHKTGASTTFSGYRLSIMTEDIEGNISTSAYYYLDTHNPEGWQDTPPPQSDYEVVKIALTNKLQRIREAGVQILSVNDETDYAVGAETKA